MEIYLIIAVALLAAWVAMLEWKLSELTKVVDDIVETLHENGIEN